MPAQTPRVASHDLCNRPFQLPDAAGADHHESAGTLEHAQAMANHSSPRTTELYDRRADEVSLDEYERLGDLRAKSMDQSSSGERFRELPKKRVKINTDASSTS